MANETPVTETATAAPEAEKTQQTESTTPKEGAEKTAPESMVTLAEVEKPKEGEKEKTETTAAKIPEKYDLKLPKDSKLDATYLEKVQAIAKEKGWTNERAQEHIEERHAAITEFETGQRRELETLNDKTWKEELFADPDFGGKNFEQNGHMAYKAAERFGGKEFADSMKAMKLNHHPQLFKFLVRVGRAMESDKIVTTNERTSGSMPIEQRLYPNMFKSKE